MKNNRFDPSPQYDFRKLEDGTWQRREMTAGAPWKTLNVQWILDRRGKHRPKLPKWNWNQPKGTS